MAIKPDWFPDWSDKPCVLVGAGQSANADLLAQLRGRVRVMVINTSYQLAPWADALYACDRRWWDWHKGAPEFAGLKVAYDEAAAKEHGLHRIDLVKVDESDAGLSLVPGLLGRGGNSGFQAFNLLLQFAARRIGLLGLDFCGRRWHGLHPNVREQAEVTLAKWRATFDAAAPQARALGADVVNLSRVSALTAYPKLSFEDAMKRWGLS